MNSVSSIKTNNAESPKTPGGIRKALLTPCRRVGLSRKWKKSGSSPFISPLSGTNSSNEVKEENILSKRKKLLADEPEETESNSTNECDTEDYPVLCNTPKIGKNRTPSRNISSRKKSKIQLTPEECHQQTEVLKEPQRIVDLNQKGESICKEENMQQDLRQHGSKVSKLSRKNSKSKINKSPANLEHNKEIDYINYPKLKIADNEAQLCNKESGERTITEEKNPNNLTKECMVVIQKKIFKTVPTIGDISETNETKKISSQTLFDSEEDDVPLSFMNPVIKLKGISDNSLKQKENIHNSKEITSLNIDIRDDDFVGSKKVTVKTLENKTTSTSGLKTNLKDNNKASKSTKKPQTVQTPKPISQSSNSFDDDDDFDFDTRKTILIKKSYNKVTKPLKAKSTGSITQKDIDEIKARIKSKKNLLLAREMSNETKELRDLIKKWQTGCQTALTELVELMRTKMPDQKMEYSELLRMLKIPPDLVAYDSENDCFNTPDDAKIILSIL